MKKLFLTMAFVFSIFLVNVNTSNAAAVMQVGDSDVYDLASLTQPQKEELLLKNTDTLLQVWVDGDSSDVLTDLNDVLNTAIERDNKYVIVYQKDYYEQGGNYLKFKLLDVNSDEAKSSQERLKKNFSSLQETFEMIGFAIECLN